MTRGSHEETLSIADLLFKAKLITQDQLARAMATSVRTTHTMASAVMQSGIISTEILRTANLAHSLVTEKLISADLAANAINKAVTQKMSLEEAFDQLGWRTDTHIVTGRLSQILTESEIVSEADLINAKEASFASGLPLGRVLVLRQVVPEALAYSALTAQVLIREGKITAEQGIAALKLTAAKRQTLDEALTNIGALPAARQEPIRLGELLIAAGLVSEIDLLSAVEKGMSDETPIGQVLLNHGLLQPHVLEKALTLQFMVNTRTMGPLEAVAILQSASLKPPTEMELQGQAQLEYAPATTIDLPDSALFGLYKKEDWMRTVQELTLEKQNLAFKVVSQQEEMKYRLARELHDTIIADLMMLKRYLGGDKQLSTEDTIEIVDHIIRQLRDICSDFAPRNFKEWGLQMCLSDMLERMSQRTGIATRFDCKLELPELPDPVGLHTFRIIQEALNNVEKYSGASEVALYIERPTEKHLRFSLTDNGRGFETTAAGAPRRSDDTGGMGMGGMKERADLIRCFFPTQLTVYSRPGEGSTVNLEIQLP